VVAGALAGALMLILALPTAAGAATAATSVTALSANPLLGPLSAGWWKWIAEQPASTNLLFSESGVNCGQAQPPGPVFFLAGSAVGPVTRSGCTVPAGKAIFFPIVNVANIKTVAGETAQDLWNQVHIDAGLYR
jgi:hypothetical protein